MGGIAEELKGATRMRSARAHMDKLIKIVEEQKSSSLSKVATELSVKLVSLTERDDRVLPGYIRKNHGST